MIDAVQAGIDRGLSTEQAIAEIEALRCGKSLNKLYDHLTVQI